MILLYENTYIHTSYRPVQYINNRYLQTVGQKNFSRYCSKSFVKLLNALSQLKSETHLNEKNMELCFSKVILKNSQIL
jgi:hypothetical protein